VDNSNADAVAIGIIKYVGQTVVYDCAISWELFVRIYTFINSYKSILSTSEMT
jgi:hypothetical protein